MLWHCWLGGRKGIRPVKNWAVGCWRGYLSGARCRVAYGPADATVSCFSKIQIGFTFLVLAHLGSPGQRAVKRVWVCVSFILSWRPITGYRGAGLRFVSSPLFNLPKKNCHLCLWLWMLTVVPQYSGAFTHEHDKVLFLSAYSYTCIS